MGQPVIEGAHGLSWASFQYFCANEVVISVLVPFLVTSVTILVNWLVQGGKFQGRYAMIGSDLVICFVAILAIHFFRIYRSNVIQRMDGAEMANLMLSTFVLSLVMFVALLICMGMERSCHTGDTVATVERVGRNILLGAGPLGFAAFLFANNGGFV